MKTLLALVSFGLASGGLLFADVSKEDVKKLLGAGLSDEVILKYVGEHSPMAKLSPEDVADLKNAGASDALLKGLLEASAPTYAQTPYKSMESPSYSTGETYVYSYNYPYYYPYYYFYPYYYPYRNYYYPPSVFFSLRANPRHHVVTPRGYRPRHR